MSKKKTEIATRNNSSLSSKTKSLKKRINKIELCPWQRIALTQNYDHFAMLCGVATGKSWTGAHFIILEMIKEPWLTSFIGANTYDQLSQVTLREFIYWLDEYGFTYEIDRKPAWTEKKFKDYSNIISVKIGQYTHTIFTRVLSKPNPLRGLEFSKYWIDETRDTPKDTHDVILSRLRESDHCRGLVTTTASGEDWVWERFVGKIPDPQLYGSIHVSTLRSVEYGIITEQFYRTMRASYSPRLAAQELDAVHVNVMEGRCYYAQTEENYEYDYIPNAFEPLIVGCDFNFSPAPMVWMIGQICDEGLLHWFDELQASEVGTPEMARRLGAKYGEWFLRIFGDASGTRGTTSNSGQTDFDQISYELLQMGVHCSVDSQQYNPLVRDRIENMNRMFRDANNNISMKYDPNRCPLFHQDMGKVVWKHGKPSDGGNHLLTHASDGGGYAAMKLFPPATGHHRIGHSVPSTIGRFRY